MSLEEALAANTAAIKELTVRIELNNKLMTPISQGVTSKREAAAAGDPPPPPATTGEPVRRRRKSAEAEAGPSLPPDPKDDTFESFTEFVRAFLAVGDSSDNAKAERAARKDFVLELCDHLDVGKINECDALDRPVLVNILKDWTKDKRVDYKSRLPVEDDGKGERSPV